jgi:hypothetical protein
MPMWSAMRLPLALSSTPPASVTSAAAAKTSTVRVVPWPRLVAALGLAFSAVTGRLRLRFGRPGSLVPWQAAAGLADQPDAHGPEARDEQSARRHAPDDERRRRLRSHDGDDETAMTSAPSSMSCSDVAR